MSLTSGLSGNRCYDLKTSYPRQYKTRFTNRSGTSTHHYPQTLNISYICGWVTRRNDLFVFPSHVSSVRETVVQRSRPSQGVLRVGDRTPGGWKIRLDRMCRFDVDGPRFRKGSIGVWMWGCRTKTQCLDGGRQGPVGGSLVVPSDSPTLPLSWVDFSSSPERTPERNILGLWWPHWTPFGTSSPARTLDIEDSGSHPTPGPLHPPSWTLPRVGICAAGPILTDECLGPTQG